jgi:hypothetical protein
MRPFHIFRTILSVAFPAIMFPVIYFLQIRLGYEVALFPLYLIPVAKLSWEFGWRGGVVAVVLATALWLVASFHSDQPYSHEWIRYYNTAVRGFIFTLTSITLLTFRQVIEQHRRRMESMRALLNVCHGCGSVQGSDGRWIAFHELNKITNDHTCECPSCTAEAEKRAAKKA